MILSFCSVFVTGGVRMKKLFQCGLVTVSLVVTWMLTSCSTVSTSDYTVGYKDVLFRAVDFTNIDDVRDSDWAPAMRAFKKSCSTSMAGTGLWKEACRRALETEEEGAKDFFTSAFVPWEVVRVRDGKYLDAEGLMTGYYEPMLRGSRVKTKRYATPLLGVPDDLVTVDGSFHPQLKGLRLKGKVSNHKLVAYDARKTLVARRDLESAAICWVDDPVDAFFLQIQGSGRVKLEDGTFVRVGYADSNGQPYRALSQWLIKNAGMKASEMSMQRIRAWAKAHPKRRNELLNYNPNYVFFQERFGYSDEDGPIGSQGVPLTALGSVAVDRSYWPMGTPFVVKTEQLLPPLSFVRPVVAQDTGGAIKGAIRFDYFWGYGDEAGERAGGQKSTTKAWVLIPKGHSPQELR